jgi:UDP-2-acetamido-3-amino-2,3-dideoxy-glucuronate N-acetyltransferase
MQASIASSAFIHDTAAVEDGVSIGEGSKIWHQAQIRTNARIGKRCIIGKGVFVDFNVTIGDDCKLQNYACVYHGVRLGRGVFVGPHAVFANDRYPRSVDARFTQLRDADWEVGEITVGDGASIGACATVLPDVHIGKWAVVGAGAVVTRDVPAYAAVLGAPARLLKYVCACGRPVADGRCATCGSLPEDHPLKSTPNERS